MTPGRLYQAIAWLLSRLAGDDASRRAFEETLADWRRERRTLKGLASVIRVVAQVAWKETWSWPMVWTTARIGIALLTLVGVWWSVAMIVWGPSRLTVATWLYGAVPLATVLLPAAVLIGLAWPSRHRVGLAGGSLTALVAGAAAVVIVTPLANDARNQTPPLRGAVPAQTTGWRMTARESWPTSSLAYMRLERPMANVDALRTGYLRGWSAVSQVNLQLAYVASCLAATWLGLVLSRRRRVVRLLMAALAIPLVLYQDDVAGLFDGVSIVWWFAGVWVPALMCVASMVLLGGAGKLESRQ